MPSHRDLRFAPTIAATKEEAAEAVRQEAQFWSGLAQRIQVPTVMLSFDFPPYRALGEADGLLPGGLGRHVRQTNLELADLLPNFVTLVDAEALQGRLGPAWHDPGLYAMCKQPFGMGALPEVADTIAAAATAILGRSRKVLVLDLDHTLWGGVVGDVGAEGLALGPETAEGEAFFNFQRYCKALAQRGVILAVCSKNNDSVARAAFANHPAMVLKPDDISCFIANFDDKATNIRRIAETLNVGLDSLVFVDDNPVERAWVSQQLPEVWVIDIDIDNPAGYCAAVELAKAFPLHRLTREDLARTASYRAIAEAKAGAESATDIDSFLKDLTPVVTIERVDDSSIDRIVQLIGKTNQFKLNPSSFTHDRIREGAAGVVALRLIDRLQDYGIVAIAVTESEGDALVIRNWVMSCRVFSRRLEHATREILSDLAEREGLRRIVLDYVPSAKNGLVPAALAAVGFTEIGDGRFEAPVTPPDALAPHHMAINDKREVFAKEELAV
jgi:FkbH-like protein